MDKIQYLRIFSSSNSYQIALADVRSTLSDEQVIDHLLNNEYSEIRLARITRCPEHRLDSSNRRFISSDQEPRLIRVEHPRYYGPDWTIPRDYVSRMSYLIREELSRKQ